MKRLVSVAFVLAVGVLLSGQAIQPIPVPQQPLTKTFSLPTGDSLHFIAATGCSDSNTGLAPIFTSGTNGPWCTPNHAINCGDVILVKPGTYTNQFDTTFGTVSNCPSTTGGIDGRGGIYFAIALCAGTSGPAHLGDCTINGGTGNAVQIEKNNWSVQGFLGSQNTSGARACYIVTDLDTGVNYVYTAFVNNIASQCKDAGFTNGASDMAAYVGLIAYNAANSITFGAECGSGISAIPHGSTVTTTGITHVYIAQTFTYNNWNREPNGCVVSGGHSDGEGIILDSWGNIQAGGYPYQGVIENNVMWFNGNSGFQIFPQAGATADIAQYYVRNNTSWSNNQDSGGQGGGDMWLHQVNPSGTGKYVITNNLFQATCRQNGCIAGPSVVEGGSIECSGSNCNNTAFLSVTGNYFWSSFPTTHPNSSTGPSTDWNVNPSWIVGAGTNTYNDPGLTNPTSLPTTTAPNTTCASYTNVVDCMNTGFNVYNLIKPTNAAQTKGYQPPGPCLTDTSSTQYTQFPTWLKGIVYLSALDGYVTNSRIQQRSGLVTKPCNL